MNTWRCAPTGIKNGERVTSPPGAAQGERGYPRGRKLGRGMHRWWTSSGRTGKGQEGWPRSHEATWVPPCVPFSASAARPPGHSALPSPRVLSLNLARSCFLTKVLAVARPGVLTFKPRSKSVARISSGEALPCSAHALGLGSEERTVSEQGLRRAEARTAFAVT